MAGSFAFPEQIWKKQINLITINTNINTAYAIGTIIVQQSANAIMPERISTTVNLRACLTWNETYFDVLLASKAITIPTAPIR